jgi:hypothetical protein
MGYYLIRSSL